MTKAFDFKQFVLSWKNNAELMRLFWIFFAGIFIAAITNIIPLLGFVGMLISIYVYWRYAINEVLFNAMSTLKYQVERISLIDLFIVTIIYFIGIILPWWSGLYFIAQIIVAVLAIGSLFAMPFIGIILLIIYLLMILYNLLRLSLTMQAYMIKKDAVNAIKESWKMTEGNIIKILIYGLKSVWYFITTIWIFLLLLIIIPIILIVTWIVITAILNISMEPFFVLLVLLMFVIGMIIGVYIQTVGAYIYYFALAAIYHIVRQNK